MVATDRIRRLGWLLCATAGLVGCGLPSVEETTEFLAEGAAECVAGERCGPAPAGSIATWHRTSVELHITQDLVEGFERFVVTAAHIRNLVCPPMSDEVLVRVDDGELDYLETAPDQPCPRLGWGLLHELVPEERATTVMTISDGSGHVRFEHSSLRSSRQPILRAPSVAAGAELVVDLPGEGMALVDLHAFVIPAEGEASLGPLGFEREDGAARLSIPPDLPAGDVVLELHQELQQTGGSGLCTSTEEEAMVYCSSFLQVRSRHQLSIRQDTP